MNWGKKVLIVFILFAGMIITMVIMSMRQNFDLVTDNYYEEELKFQDQIDATKNASVFAQGIQLSMSANEVILQMPLESLIGFTKGQIVFYRASDARLDITENLSLNEAGVQTFDRKKFVSGNYEVKLSWEADGKIFYHQTTIQL